MYKFEIGEIAILYKPGALLHKQEVEIVSELMQPGAALCAEPSISTEPAYYVVYSNGERGLVAVRYLRKKKPPKENKDIQETRQLGAPSFNEMMRELKNNEKILIS